MRGAWHFTPEFGSRFFCIAPPDKAPPFPATLFFKRGERDSGYGVLEAENKGLTLVH